jgi:hypothetical protein
MLIVMQANLLLNLLRSGTLTTARHISAPSMYI